MKFDYELLSKTEKIIFALRALYAEYGYARYTMTKFEEYDLYGKNKDYLLSERVITFTDTDGKLMALKPDVTLSIIKNTDDDDKGVKKLCYNENVYRVSKGTGCFKEIVQTGIECIGNVDDGCVFETLTLAAKSLNEISGDYVLELTDLDVLRAALDKITDFAPLKAKLLKCAGEKNVHGVIDILTENGIPEKKAADLIKLLSVYGSPESVFNKLKTLDFSIKIDKLLKKLKTVVGMLKKEGLADKVFIDFSLVSDFNYYSGVAFKGFVKGVPDSVLSGGEYDNLMKKMGKKSKAIGFAVYLDWLTRINIGGDGNE